MKKIETTLFFGATVSALTLVAIIGLQEFSVGSAVQQAVALPIVKLEAVEIVGKRPVQAPEQVALVR